ncbi:TIGR00341 family protein [Candidatus Sulfurimonas baltica]|nr:TIGR00341 family protein [Candidatus Sulfurimonas baltica]
MVLSTLLATTGLFANSAPVIIGAMILAPPMAPIVSLSMGVIRAEKSLMKDSVRTLIYGIATALTFSALFTFFIPLQQITPEMQGRLNPNLLDLMVAIFSGIAGAYANAKEEIAKSLAGVAIAVALVPPLSVTGIGIGLGNVDVIYGSFLLFITNLVGITLSAAMTFVVLGYAPIKRAQKGIIYTSVMMFIIAIPLLISFIHMVEKNDYYKKIEAFRYMELSNTKIELNILHIQTQDDSVLIDLEVLSTDAITNKDLQVIKNLIEDKIEKNVVLKVTSKIIFK